MHDYLGDLRRHHLPRADIEWDALPAPVVNIELHCYEGLRLTIGSDLVFFTIGTLLLALPFALGVLPSDDSPTNLLGVHRAEGLIYLDNLVAE